jgi:hypothetical protein
MCAKRSGRPVRADALILRSHERSRKKLLRRHLAQRRNLFAKAVISGDYRTALAVARDEAELQGLYPPKGVAVAGKNGGPIVLNITEEIVLRQPPAALPDIVEVVVSPHERNGTPTNDPPAPGPARLPPV